MYRKKRSEVYRIPSSSTASFFFFLFVHVPVATLCLIYFIVLDQLVFFLGDNGEF